jgi:Dullard-like phosphatase family protein
MSSADFLLNTLIYLLYLIFAFLKILSLAFSICRRQRRKDPFGMIKTSKGKKTLLLDLDGTLVLTNTSEAPCSSELTINGKKVFVHKRPYLKEFLSEVKNIFNIGIYTSSKQDYADQVIKLIGIDREVPKQMRYYRNHCSLINGNYMKMLTLVDPDLRNVLILDNRPEVVMDKRNVVKIKSWEGGQDQELIFSLKILKEKGAAEDVRSHF